MCSSWPGQTARMCVLEGQGEGASRARACLHDVVSSSSARFVIFLLPSLSCPSPPTRGRGRTSEPPSVRPSVRSPLPLLAASREFRITPNVRSSVRPAVRSRHDRSTEMEVVAARGGADVGHVLRPPSCCVASSSSFRLLSCAPLPALRDCARGTAPIASKHVWNDYLNDSKLARGLKKIGLGMAPLRGPQISPEVLALAFRTQFLSGQVLHGMFPLLCRILCLWVTVRTSPDSMVGIIQ